MESNFVHASAIQWYSSLQYFVKSIWKLHISYKTIVFFKLFFRVKIFWAKAFFFKINCKKYAFIYFYIAFQIHKMWMFSPINIPLIHTVWLWYTKFTIITFAFLLMALMVSFSESIDFELLSTWFISWFLFLVIRSINLSIKFGFSIHKETSLVSWKNVQEIQSNTAVLLVK
jgi:hypothetical protein